MKRFRLQGKIIIAVMAIMCFLSSTIPIDAATVTALGRKDSTDTYVVEIDEDNIVNFRSDAGIKFPYQSGTTNDTLTAADSGRTFVTSSGTVSSVFLNLPDAVPGLNYPVITGTTHSVYINPLGTDIINYASLAAGDSIYNSSAAKGDSIVLICVIADQWEVDIHNGTWATGGGVE